MSDDNQAPVVSIKGFDQNFRCRGFQFEVGQTYSVGGKVKACKTGFHGCPLDEHPFSVTAFYGFQSRFAIVEQSGERDFSGPKLASASITIKEEISLHDLIARAVKWVFDRSRPEGASATGYSGAASATGARGAASATGMHCVAIGVGYLARAMATETNAICLVCRADDGSIIAIRASMAGENGIKPGIWYSLNEAGEFVECED